MTDPSSADRPILAHFSCDHCRRQKFKCSREIPKCSVCKPWPGSCVYSRDNPPMGPHSNTGPSIANSQANPQITPESIETRLERIERAIEQLAGSVNKIVGTVGSANLSDSTSTFSQILGSSVLLKKTRGGIETTTDTPGFRVPSRRTGYYLISQFLEHSELGEAFFCMPSDEILRQVVFDPENVPRKAWVVYFNHTMLALLSNEESYKHEEAESFRQNVRLALNDSSIFLEPHEANVQALTFLAMHGEDYATPRPSWIMMGHACRQAEVLNLHRPAYHDPGSQQRNLSLFWLLFMFDKSSSLAFGCSPLLPTAYYGNVPFPDFDYLLKFQPHNSSVFGSHANTHTSTFGAHLLTQSFKMSKLTGRILDKRVSGGIFDDTEAIKIELDTWYQQTNQILSGALDAESYLINSDQRQEMTLGITCMKFHYLHVLIFLLKGNSEHKSLRLDSAREAISLLPAMVSNWGSVYNGVLWHLLYYPFIPFFVIFKNIVQDSDYLSPAVDNDLGLLSETVSYFANMSSKCRLLITVCSRLEQIATVFLHLAQAHTSNDSHHHEDVTVAAELEGIDIINYLEWLPADISTQWQHKEDEPMADMGIAESRALDDQKRMLDCTFDWFAWDAYYAG
ncbi:hypothetical protein BDV25DRAFT_128093 [Aspergillus avenaceus]|uniref:Zn(2)-C6 fungal-type domain-containing protein n=1 Tax=Aspergillus avenaceus TaxID=36643 RepID=A0A5N6U251_ASPAV|nr:hypothetical protein BDV25DRAFT_128093 [Aspergillus avenaceus]